MKIKSLAILFLVFITAYSLQAKKAIKDVECLTGEDFVQLHFKTDKIIPIPDLFYPEKDNFQLIVMRIHNVAFKVPENRLAFNSAIIKSVNIVHNKKYVDVEIRLKEKVNYRVFTNQNGIYIEFPNVKKIEAPVKITKPVLEKSKKNPGPKPVQKAPETILDQTPSYTPPVRSSGGRSELRTFRITERSKDRIKFEFLMTDSTDYKVIPIPQYPVRLAIDLINTSSRRIMEDVDFLNVKTLRGAYNTPQIYRLVFDLLYLKNYSVVFNENVLEVEFFNKLTPQKDSKLGLTSPQTTKDRDVTLVKNTLPQKDENADKPIPLTGSDTESREIKNVDPVNEQKINTQKDKNITTVDNEVLQTNVQKVNPVSDKGDFFTEEKSKVAFEGFSSTPIDEPDERKTVSQIVGSQRTISVGEKRYSGEPMDFNFKDADLNNVLLFFAKLSGLNILIDPGVSGKVTATMFQVPWDQALEYFLKINKLDMVQEGNILRIGRVDDLAREAQQRRRLQEARQMEGKLDVWSVYLNYAEVDQVKGIVQKYLTPRGEIVTDKRTNQLIITDVPKNRETLDKLIETLDLPTQQVSIEARIVETKASYTQNFGIQWGYNFIADSAYGNQTSLSFPNSVYVGGNLYSDPKAPGLTGPLGGYAINLPSPAFTSGTVFSFGNVANTFRLDAALTAMEKKGKGRVISAPRTLTQNNAEATMEQGRQIPVQTIENNTIKIKYVYATLELKVKPQITAEGMIICRLTIKNNAADFANLVNGIPPILTQELVTTVMIRDGATLVVGGLYKINDEQTKDSVPLLSKIPILGNLFKNSLKIRDKNELLIFVTPRIVK